MTAVSVGACASSRGVEIWVGDGGDIFKRFSAKVRAEVGKKMRAGRKFLSCTKGDPERGTGNEEQLGVGVVETSGNVLRREGLALYRGGPPSPL